MKSILWLCDQRGSECDRVSQHITIALSEQFPQYIHKFAYYSDHPPHTIRAWVREADIIICRHPAALELLKQLNVMKRTVLQFSTTKPNLILEELIQDIKMTATSGNVGEAKTEDKETASGFSIKNGQVFYDGKDLKFPAGQIQDFFKKLTKTIGLTVTYAEFDKITTIEKIRVYKSHASKILKDESVPYEIISLTNEGYVLRLKSE